MHHAKITPTAVSSAQLEEVSTPYVQYPEGLLPIIGEAIGGEPDENAVDRPLRLCSALVTQLRVITACVPVTPRNGGVLRGRCGCLSVIDIVCIGPGNIVSVIPRSCGPWSVAAERCWGNGVIRWVLIDGGEFFGG